MSREGKWCEDALCIEFVQQEKLPLDAPLVV